ncbi:MAG: hypothetical protein V3U76_15720 [Granulosicoccus sp.]
MNSPLKILLIAVVVVLVLAATYNWQMGRSDRASTDPGADAAVKNEMAALAEATTITSPESAKSESAASPSPTDSSAETTATAGESMPSQSKASPFALVPQAVDTESGLAENTTDDAESNSPNTINRQTNRETSAAGSVLTSGQPLAVPSSYPVSDAEKYFIPKSQRSPGNLGGPPPPNFPGGPNNPNQMQPAVGGELTPSPVPEQ